LDKAAAGAAGVSVSNAAEPATEEAATDAASAAGARRAELLAVGDAFGGAGGARVAGTDMGAMGGFGSSAGPAVYPPALRAISATNGHARSLRGRDSGSCLLSC
jgi:hypothetical protein